MYLLIFIILISIVLFGSRKNPSVIYAFVLCTYATEQWFQSKDVFFLQYGWLINVVNGMLVLIALIYVQMRKGGILKGYPLVGWLSIFLFLYASVSVFWSSVYDVSVSNLLHHFPYFILFVLLTPLLIKNIDDLYRAYIFMAVFGVCLSILLLFFAEWGYRRIMLAMATEDLRSNPLAIANMAGYVFFSAVLLNLKKEQVLWTVLRWVVVLVCLGIAIKTGSRGQFILMILLGVILLPISRSITNIKKFVPIAFSAVFILLVSYFALQEMTSSYTEKEGARWDAERMEEDVAGRFESASNLLAVWWDTPQSILFGLGSSASYDENIAGFYTHIVPLEILGELGLIGFVLFIGIIILTFKKFFRLKRSLGVDSVRRGVLSVTAAIALFEFLLSFKQGSLLGSQILFCSIIVLAKIDLFMGDEKTDNRNKKKKQEVVDGLHSQSDSYASVKLK